MFNWIKKQCRKWQRRRHYMRAVRAVDRYLESVDDIFNPPSAERFVEDYPANMRNFVLDEIDSYLLFRRQYVSK